MGKRHHSYCKLLFLKRHFLMILGKIGVESGEIYPKNRSYILEGGGKDKADIYLIE